MNRTVQGVAGRLEIDGMPRLVLSGEVHYFRLARADWSTRIRQAVDAGLDTIATYIPWIWHELDDGSVDLTGRTVPERDLLGFLDLCAAEGVDVIARPGPFVMAELKNEGIPYRVAARHPELRTVTWNGERSTTRSLDYTAPAFLAEADGWLSQVLPPLVERQATRGGPVIAIQLDNEVGMLDWVSNSPALTDSAIREFDAWLRANHSDTQVEAMLGGGDLAASVRTGGVDALAAHHALGLFMRDRLARYLQHLEQVARDFGAEVPLLVNVHGTSDSRTLLYPIGVSQLAQAYRGRDGIIAGSDFYLGELTVRNAADLYLANAIMRAVNGPDQPVTALEFEAGSGDYGEDLDALSSPQATVLKTLLSVAQGNRLINYYLFTGGRNPHISVPEPDGNGRIAFTGERHGFAAPIDPEGVPGHGVAALRDAAAELRALEPVLATATEEFDDLVFGFVADHYLTEYHHPDAAPRAEQVADTERHRGIGLRSTFGRSLVMAGFTFPALDLQAAADPDSAWAAGQSVPYDPATAIALSSGRTLGEPVQRFLAEHVAGGGRLLLTGRLPDRDERGIPCTVLADALGLTDDGVRVSHTDPSTEYYPSVIGVGEFADLPEVRVASLQLLGGAGDVVLRAADDEHAVARLVRHGQGTALVLGCDYPVHLATWRRLLALVEVRPRITHDAAGPGLIVTSVRAAAGDRVVFALNVAPHPLDAQLRIDGEPVGERFALAARGHAMFVA